jgi:hypothetical protein
VKKILLASIMLAVCASPAAASVSVRVSAVGPTSLPRTAVTMPTTAPQQDGHDCSVGTAGAALDAAVGTANWSAHWDSTYNQLVLDSIFGEAHPFGSHLFWSVYVDGKSALFGACDQPVSDGQYVQYVALCDPYDPPGPGTACFGEPLQLQAPPSAAPGASVGVTVTESQTDINTGTTTIVPSAGATVSADGRQATTDADGHASLTPGSRGPITVIATKGSRVDDSATTCITDGSDGYCGSSVPATPAPCVHNGDDGLCSTPDHKATYGFIKSIREHQRFAKGKGPRELKGTSDPDPSGLEDVQLRLTKRVGTRCFTFSGTKLRFVAMKRCGARRGTWFSIGSKADWSYLLPKALGRGRYVLDLKTIDGAGNADTQLARTRNRVVFFVG